MSSGEGRGWTATRREACALALGLIARPTGALSQTVHAGDEADLAGMPQAGATLLVGGPPDGTASEFATLLAPLLGPALLGPAPGVPHPEGRLALDATGGLDGVTAANEFEARANPDGSTALMIPGAAALAWLAGDPRVHFDAGLWVPALVAIAPAVLVGRTPLERLPIGASLRLAASSPAGADLPALLGLELIRLRADPVFNMRLQADQEAALRDRSVDAILLTGRGVPQRLERLQTGGFTPLFALGRSDAAVGARDPALPHVETLDELVERFYGHEPRGPLAPAYRASAAAAQLDAALVLPQLAPAGTVARWRAACNEASASPALQSATSEQSLRPLAAPDCVTAVSAVLAGQTAMLDLHRFLADRYGWHPA